MASPKSTLPNSREEQDSAYNPGDLRFSEENFNAGNLAEQAEAYANDPSKHDADLQGAEEAGDEPLKNGFYRPSPGGKQEKITLKGIFKKKGPLGVILAVVLGGGGAATFLLSPGLGIVQLKEILVGDLNDQLAAFDIRSDAMLRTKLKGLQADFSVCSNAVKIRCQFGTVSKRMADKLGRAGFVIETEERAFGRQFITSMRAPDGTLISDPQELTNLRRTNQSVRSALNRVYNPLVASMTDSKAISVLKDRFRTSPSKKLTATTPEGLDENLTQSTAGENLGRDAIIQVDPAEGRYVVDSDGDRVYESSDPDRFGSIAGADDILSQADEVARSGGKAVTGVIGGALKGVSIVGAADAACTVYNTARAVAAAAKMTRSIQLAQYSMVFLNTADSIKAGTATPEEVEYLGNILTSTDARETITDELSSISEDAGVARDNPFYGKNAFDSPGYAVAAYNDAPTLTTRSQQYMVGGGLTGTLSDITSTVASTIGVGNPDAIPETCGVIQSWWVRGVGLAVGVAAAIGSFGTSTVISIGASLAIAIALPFLEAALADIIAGQVVGPDTKGVDAGDATFAGTSALLGGVAQSRGLKPLTESELEPYLTTTNQIESEYIAQATYEAQSTPLDIMNQYSFLGSLARTLNLSAIKASSGTSAALASIPNFLSSSLASIVPSANAALTFNPERFEKCSDKAYDKLHIKADVFCNVRYGLSSEELAMDPNTVLDYMLNGGHITRSGSPLSDDYEDFMTYCADRVDGWGETGQEGGDFSKTSGEWCMKNNNKMSNFRIYTIDKTVSDAIDDEEPSVSNAGTIASPVSPGTPVTSSMGPRVPPCSSCSKYHQGTDFSGSNHAVYVIMDGTVERVGVGINNIVFIRHEDGLVSSYWHMADANIKVAVGDTVTAGEQIGLMGSVGQSTGIHLHIELDISDVEDRSEYEQYRISDGGANPGNRVDVEDFLAKNGVEGF
jgi:hypothetical protein